MNEDLVADVFLYGAAGFYQVAQAGARLLVLLLLGVNHEDEGTAVLDGRHVRWRGLFQLSWAWEVFNGKLDVLVIVNL